MKNYLLERQSSKYLNINNEAVSTDNISFNMILKRSEPTQVCEPNHSKETVNSKLDLPKERNISLKKIIILTLTTISIFFLITSNIELKIINYLLLTIIVATCILKISKHFKNKEVNTKEIPNTNQIVNVSKQEQSQNNNNLFLLKDDIKKIKITDFEYPDNNINQVPISIFKTCRTKYKHN